MASIELNKVTIQFPIYSIHNRSIKNSIIGGLINNNIRQDIAKYPVITGLNSLSLTLKEGDRLGVTGNNGAGKSTLLRTIAGIYSPISGYVKIEGRVSSLIDVSLGMDPEATGFENIRTRGVLMGLKLKQIKDIEEEIADFTELGSFLELPIRTYSSGMHMRLGFAVSTAIPADILLMDEWLSVGDKEFSLKAEKRLTHLINKTAIVVIASHSEELIQKTTNQTLRLEHSN